MCQFWGVWFGVLKQARSPEWIINWGSSQQQMRALRILNVAGRFKSFITFRFSTKRYMEPDTKAPTTAQLAPTLPAENLPADKNVDAKKKKDKEPKQPKEPKEPKEKKEKKEPEEKQLEVIYINHEVDTYGDYEMIASKFVTKRVWTKLIDIDEAMKGKQVLIRARVHNIRGKGNNCFVVLREQFSTLQAVIFKNETNSKEMIKYISATPCESIVDVTGTIVVPEKPIESCTQKVQLQITKFFVVNRAASKLPIQVQDASRKVIGNEFENQEETKEKEADKEATVSMKNRLDNRVIDLRTPAKQAIFRISSGVCQLFREFLDSNGFIEIHTPKLIGGSSEGGANVFKLKYFNQEGCLAQSPQLYKQICVMADMDRVYQIGPVFRAENAFTHRHMCEFTGLDLEMTIKESYTQLLDFLGELMCSIFKGLDTRFAKELKAINQQFEFEPFKFVYPPLKLTFEQGIQLLKDNGIEWSVMEDLSTPIERQLGQIVRKKYNTDFYILHRYPKTARPFYTMLCHDDPNFTCSYDFFMRGQEIISGAQRIHDPVILEKRAAECGINPDTIRDYINSFKYGAFPHGGCGVGLERVVMLFCALKNIRNASLFPRDPKRLTP